MLVCGNQIFLRLEGRNVWFCFWLLDLFLLLSILKWLDFRRNHSFLYFVFSECFLGSDEVLVIVVYLLDEDPMSLDRTTVIMKP